MIKKDKIKTQISKKKKEINNLSFIIAKKVKILMKNFNLLIARKKFKWII